MKGNGEAPSTEERGQVKAVRTARVRVGRGDASSTQQLLTTEGRPAGSRTEPAHRGFCRRIRVCFLRLKQAGHFPSFPVKHSKLSFSRVTPPPGRGATLTRDRGKRPPSAVHCSAHQPPAAKDKCSLSRGIRSSVTVLILANTSRDSTFPHPGVVLSVPT